MNAGLLRELLGKGLPKIAASSINAIYPMDFQAVQETARDYTVDAQVVGSQLVYSRNYQVHSFLIMQAAQIFMLGQLAFPKYGRAESPKRVVAANGEVLSTIMGKVAYVVGKVDEDAEVTTAPPIVLNCSGANQVSVRGAESFFLKLVARDLSMLMVASVQQV